jgi:hypothetical protein
MSRESKYASHLPVLKMLYEIRPYNNVLEFGCGNYSTKYFVENCNHVTSIENMDEKWYDKIKNEIKSDRFTISYAYGFGAVESFKKFRKNYDFIFVDGIERPECINASFEHSPVIAIHDVGMRAIKRGGLAKVLPKLVGNYYKMFVVNLAMPNTTIFTNDDFIINSLRKNKNCYEVSWNLREIK